ncbi:hypothetical protein [Streptomyces sp. NPDC048428]|uniref:hypothetical protein n=1 Tax=Streptomyces sp. NPDC048428 TaxID=3154503 RepID=UPI003426843B
MNPTVIMAMFLAALLGLGRVLDEVESLKGRIIKMIRSFAEVRDELDRAKRTNRPESPQGDQLEQAPGQAEEDPGAADADDPELR